MGVSRVGIVGAGTMGQGIATACAGAGLGIFAERTATTTARSLLLGRIE